ncbi:hypothetical protein J1605_009582 [Eschrichtius robustus]|uniref:Uncharacterized protein n=1 Tax=Eschrichtius robustus TaxID=9764 RepID=A0AB34GX42_ESCRO|nr:hypothetical protein J1605_009582 [Eschrichtius robustus]
MWGRLAAARSGSRSPLGQTAPAQLWTEDTATTPPPSSPDVSAIHPAAPRERRGALPLTKGRHSGQWGCRTSSGSQAGPGLKPEASITSSTRLRGSLLLGKDLRIGRASLDAAGSRPAQWPPLFGFPSLCHRHDRPRGEAAPLPTPWPKGGGKKTAFLVSSVHSLTLSGEENTDPTVGTPLGAQWLRTRLPARGTQVRALVREDPTCRGATNPTCRTTESHNY